MIVFDASTLVSAPLKADGLLERALLRAQETDVLVLSAAVDFELSEVLNRPKFARVLSSARRLQFLEFLRRSSIWFEPSMRVMDCRDPKDDKYLELALASGAETIVSSDSDLLVLHPWRRGRSMLKGSISTDDTSWHKPILRQRSQLRGRRS